jgi:hypothetical protein
MRLFEKAAAPLVALLSLAACEVPPGAMGGPGKSATASLPMFDATCPGNISIHGNAGGPILVNSEEASVEKFSETYFEATQAEITASISINPDQSVSVAYTGPEGANGLCTVAG